MKYKKAIAWAYASSPSAEQFGFETGCFVVQIESENPPISLGGFPDIHKAKEFADQIQLDYSDYCVTRWKSLVSFN